MQIDVLMTYLEPFEGIFVSHLALIRLQSVGCGEEQLSITVV